MTSSIFKGRITSILRNSVIQIANAISPSFLIHISPSLNESEAIDSEIAPACIVTQYCSSVTRIILNEV